jgi:hypothetical protein
MMKYLPDAGKATLHCSVSEGNWVGKIPAERIKKEDRKEKGGSKGYVSKLDGVKPWSHILSVSSRTGPTPPMPPDRTCAKQDEEVKVKVEATVTKKESMQRQLLSLRSWAYNILGDSYPGADEKELDVLMDAARLHIKTENIDDFDEARLVVRMFVWRKKLPEALTDDGKMMVQQFKATSRWMQGHTPFRSEGKEISALLRKAVAAICADDREAFVSMKAEVKEPVSNAEMGL